MPSTERESCIYVYTCIKLSITKYIKQLLLTCVVRIYTVVISDFGAIYDLIADRCSCSRIEKYTFYRRNRVVRTRNPLVYNTS